ncbi:hypothetical protein RHMOL_Rhmol13G0300900 [Rhododendron molle]|uniref:Uncharacterized protein n=1 Tax=Rhododendron molle TaxID=49168 RepID=A0ACC0LD86_RHOML|nr:hypothetical protein RHMOL_Rhmol13G0300900 [Rhododendron molle]
MATGAAAISLGLHTVTKPDVEFPFTEQLRLNLKELEAKYNDYLPILTEKKTIPVGPLVHEIIDGDKDLEIFQWLDEKDELSTVFVSFGSETYLSKEEREEIAHGLLLSGVSFKWTVRFPLGERTEINEALPVEFLER